MVRLMAGTAMVVDAPTRAVAMIAEKCIMYLFEMW